MGKGVSDECVSGDGRGDRDGDLPEHDPRPESSPPSLIAGVRQQSVPAAQAREHGCRRRWWASPSVLGDIRPPVVLFGNSRTQSQLPVSVWLGRKTKDGARSRQSSGRGGAKDAGPRAEEHHRDHEGPAEVSVRGPFFVHLPSCCPLGQGHILQAWVSHPCEWAARSPRGMAAGVRWL